MKNNIVHLDDYRKKKHLERKDLDEAREFLDTIFPTKPLTKEDEEILKEIGIPMVEFNGTTLQEG